MSTRKYIISALSALLLPAAAFAQTKAPVVEYLYNTSNTVYFQIDPLNSDPEKPELEKLTLDLYTSVRSFTKLATIDLLTEDLEPYAVSGLTHVYAFPVTTGDKEIIVNQLKYKYAGEAEVTGPLKDGDDPFIYMTDLIPKENINIAVGWHIPFYDKAYNGTEPLRTVISTYAKGYGVHAKGFVETPTSLDLSPFSRFSVDLGGQVISNPTRGKLGFNLFNGGTQAVLSTGNVVWQNVAQWDFTLQNKEPGATVKIEFTDGGDGNTNDIVCIGAPRFYYNESEESRKQPQRVEFDTPGGVVFEPNSEIPVSAYATAGTPIFYAIVSGHEMATLEGNVLRIADGYNGEVVVEAMTLGDARHESASATQTYSFRFGPVVEYLYTHKNGDDPSGQTMYFYVDSKNSTLEQLSIDVYDNVRTFNHIGTVNLLADGGLDSYKVDGLANVYAIPLTVEGGATAVHRFTYKFAGEDAVESPLCEGADRFVYMTDLPNCNPLPTANYGIGWGARYYDTSYDNNGPLRTKTSTYAKGYGAHGAGWIETPSTLDLSQFSRFCVDLGGQVITNPTRGKLGYQLFNGTSQALINTGNVPWENVYEWDFTLQSTGVGKTVKVVFTNGGDGNANDVVCIGAPRFYYATSSSKLPQTIEWAEEEIVNNYRAFTMPLEAKASSGLPVLYRVIRGSEYARLDGAANLNFFNIPSEGEVVVEAYQPGNKDYEPASVSTCTFRIRKSLVIAANERMELAGGHDIDELVIFANINSAGQATVKDGIVNVKKLVLKYTFVPGQWNFIAFPSDLDLGQISNLSAKGFACAADEGSAGTYILREFDGEQRAHNPGESAWRSVTSGKVKAHKGYIMKLESADTTPIEITFNIDNVALDFDNTVRAINLAIDMSKCEPLSHHTVYIRPSNVKGNTLRVDMRYVPSSESDIPLNHAKALEAMRVMPVAEGGAIRLTLPEQTPARVAIFDKKGKRLLKAVQYVAPMKIDVSDLKHGTYRMVVVYGPASTERVIEL